MSRSVGFHIFLWMKPTLLLLFFACLFFVFQKEFPEPNMPSDQKTAAMAMSEQVGQTHPLPPSSPLLSLLPPHHHPKPFNPPLQNPGHGDLKIIGKNISKVPLCPIRLNSRSFRKANILWRHFIGILPTYKLGWEKILPTEQLGNNSTVYIKLCVPGSEHKRKSFEEH